MSLRPVLCFGEALIDFHAEGNDGRGFALHYLPYAGGAPANVAVAIATLGGQARFAGMLGKDRFGDFLFDRLQHAGVGTDDVARTDQANTALAFVSLDAHGERSFSFYRPPAADLLFRAEHFRATTFSGLALFHACSNSLTEPAIAAVTCEGMRRARSAGALVSFDLNLRPRLWPADADARSSVWPALELADVVKLSAEEFAFLAEATTEQAVLNRLWHGCTRLVVITDGSAPMRWFMPDQQGTSPTYAVKVVDSTAAGDAFVGGLLYQLAQLDGADRLGQLSVDLSRLEAVLRYAAACGALAVTKQGSFAAMPSDADTRLFLESHA